MNTEWIYKRFGEFRARRMRRFVERCSPTHETTILDVGGFSDFWRGSGVAAKITILRPEGPEVLPPPARTGYRISLDRR